MIRTIFYHGTDKESSNNILKNGFKLSFGNDYGKGIYFSKDIEYAKTYGNYVIKMELKQTAKILNLSTADGFDIFKNIDPGFYREEVIMLGFDGIFDTFPGLVIYKKSAIKSICLLTL